MRAASTVALARRSTIALFWKAWGVPIVTPFGSYGIDDVEGLEVRAASGAPRALATFSVRGRVAEIVTLDARPRGRGHGSATLRAAERELASRGVGRIRLVTTEDNLRALAFYLRMGYRLTRVHRDFMGRVRRVKKVPSHGADGLPLRDAWELSKELRPTKSTRSPSVR